VLKVPPGSPDWDAYVTDIPGVAEQFSDFVKHMFQRGEAQNVGEHGQTLSLKQIYVEFHCLQVALDSREQVSDLLLLVKI
jgi:hypothetical protein